MAVTTTTAIAITAAVAASAAAAGSVAQGIAAKNQAKAQAKVMKQQSDRERAIAAEKERDFRRQQRRLRSSVRAAGGARGIEMGTGSPLLAEEDFMKETELMADRIRRGGEVGATRLEQQADITKSSGKSAFNLGLIGAGSSLLSGYSRSARILQDYQQTNQPTTTAR